MQLTEIQISQDAQDLINGYIEAALWSSYETDSDGDEFTLNEKFDSSDFDPISLEEISVDCLYFMNKAACYLNSHRNDYLEAAPAFEDFNPKPYEGWLTETDEIDWGMIGHDLWMTRNGHGVGFWETSDYPKALGEILTQYAKAMGERNIILADDGTLQYC